jgi:hypothetical protein
MCYFADQVTCEVASNPCAGIVDVQFVPGNSCSDYYSCANGIGTPHTCPDGYLFDFARQMCYFADQVTCEVASNPCAGIEDGQFVVGSSCANYYTCQNGVGTPHTCPDGYLFDFARQMCYFADQVTCEVAISNPCAGIEDGRFVAGSSCANYYTCQNGVGTPHTCPDGYLFDFARQMCYFADQVNCATN